MRPRFPLLAKVFGWLFLHLVILGLAFVGFVGWQLGLGPDSLLSGSAGDRLRAFGNSVREEIQGLPRAEWNAALRPLARQKNVEAGVFDFASPESFPRAIPHNVMERAKTALPPPGPPGHRRPPPPRGPGGPLLGGEPPDDFGPPSFENHPAEVKARPRPRGPLPSARAVFLLRGDQGDGYWAGIQLDLQGAPGQPGRQQLLLIRADGLDGSGMFFEFKPWLWGGLAVLVLSLVFWAPFVWGITRYIHRLTLAADRIAAGQFKISLPPRGNDELGNLGQAVETMAARLDHLVSGQKRFLGDAAHELCAPLARVRTGLGILEMKLGDAGPGHLTSIESDVQDLATLIEEVLEFSRAGNRPPRLQTVVLHSLVRQIAAREAGVRLPEIHIPSHIAVMVDPAMLGRALGNLIRNARIHAGPNAKVVIEATENAGGVDLSVTDDGPGVPADELPRLFEPFYRPDRSRSRETGGSGLGLAIARTAIEACGGEVTASLPSQGGFAVTMHLPKDQSGGE